MAVFLLRPGTILLLLLIFVLALCLSPIDFPSHFYTKKVLFDAGHFPLFFVVGFGLSSISKLRAKQSSERLRFRTLAGNLLISVLFAGTIEIIQPLFDRSQELDDFLVGSLGAFFGVLGARYFLSPAALRTRIFYCCYGTLVCFFLLRDLPFAVDADEFRESRFPILGDFDDPREFPFWEAVPLDRSDLVMVSSLQTKSGAQTLMIQDRKEGRMGIRYLNGRLDWSPYNTMRLDVFLDGMPVDLELVLEDKSRWLSKRKKAVQSIHLQSGENSLSVPLSKFEGIAKEHISRFTLTLPPQTSGSHSVSVDAVRLE